MLSYGLLLSCILDGVVIRFTHYNFIVWYNDLNEVVYFKADL